MLTKSQKYKAQQKAFKTTAHVYKGKIFHWKYCTGCGHVLLKNDASRKTASKPCYSMED
jgi:hypothetical protein